MSLIFATAAAAFAALLTLDWIAVVGQLLRDWLRFEPNIEFKPFIALTFMRLPLIAAMLAIAICEFNV